MLAHILGAWSYDPCLLCLLSVYSLHCLPFSSSSFWSFSFGRFLGLPLTSLNSHDRQLLGDGRNVLWGLSRSNPRPPKPLPRLLELMIFVFKIYKEKTIEVGVFVDRHLYKNMEEVLQSYFSNGDMVIVELFLTASFLKKIHFQMLKTQDVAKVKEQFLKMIHNLFVQVLIFDF